MLVPERTRDIIYYLCSLHVQKDEETSEGHKLAPGKAGSKILLSRVFQLFSLKLTNFLICYEFWKRDRSVFLNVLKKKCNLLKDIDLFNLCTRSGQMLPVPRKTGRSHPKMAELFSVSVLMWRSSPVIGPLPLPVLGYIYLCPLTYLLY